MYESFFNAFPISDRVSTSRPRRPPPDSPAGWRELMGRYSGVTFAEGLYRLHDDESGETADSYVAAAYPDFTGWIHPFGYDWLGRQFVLCEHRRDQEARLLVLMMEPGTGEALEIPADFTAFHEVTLIEQTDAALANVAFHSWKKANPEMLPIPHSSCVGYKRPLFLGGLDEPPNFEISDLDVYWAVMGQLRVQVMGLG